MLTWRHDKTAGAGDRDRDRDRDSTTLGMLHYVQHDCWKTAALCIYVAFHATLLAGLVRIGAFRLKMLYQIQH